MNPNDNSNTGSTDAAAGQQGTDQAAAAATDTVSTDAGTAGATDAGGEQAAAAVTIQLSPIPMVPVESSQILEIGHNPETRTLAIRFKDGKQPLYHYANVDAELFDRFRNAESVGSFFYREIKPNKDAYPYQRIYEEPVAQAA